jgi:shikimate kinase
MADRAFVVGLSGVPGAGKTTLSRLLLQRYKQAEVVYYDDYQTITRMSAEQVQAWFGRGGDPNEFPLAELIAELTRRTQAPPQGAGRPILLFETPFGRLHRATGAFIDFLVWVDTPLDAALSRALLAFVDQAQRDRAPNAQAAFLKWQRQYLVNYQMVRAMYLSQRASITPNADLVIDGSKPAEVSSELIMKALAARGVAV